MYFLPMTVYTSMGYRDAHLNKIVKKQVFVCVCVLIYLMCVLLLVGFYGDHALEGEHNDSLGEFE